MPENITKLTILVSGTSETEAEKAAISRVVENLNLKLAQTHSIEYRVKKFPDDFTSGVNTDAQAEINRQIDGRTDLYIGLMGTRVGTQTPRTESGTIEELEIAHKKFLKDTTSIRIFFYFKKSTTDVFDIDTKQLEKVKEFKNNKTKDIGLLYKEFQNTEQFVDMIEQDLFNIITNDWDTTSWKDIDITKNKTVVSSDSNELDQKNNVVEIEELDEDEGEAEAGIFDLMGEFEDDIETLNKVVTDLSKEIEHLGSLTTDYTKKLEPMWVRLSHVMNRKGSSGRQKLIANIKKELYSLSKEYKKTSTAIKNDVNEFAIYISKVYKYVELTLNNYDQSNAETPEDSPISGLEIMLDNMSVALEAIQILQNSIESLPSLSKDLNSARANLVRTLGVLIAEFSLAINDGNKILDRYYQATKPE